MLHPNPYIKTVSIGRGHDSDLRVNDISVSRMHAVIKLKQDGFYLTDNKSKFGTLVLIKNTLSLSPDICKAVQVGRTVVNFSVKKSPNLNYKYGEFEKLNRKVKRF